MNKELFDSFKNLNDTAKAELKFKLKDSPVAMLLYDYLDASNNRNFKNRNVVEFIYATELTNTPYSVLENRYFKLRKKFTEEYLLSKPYSVTVLTVEEEELMTCRTLLNKNEIDKAYKRLTLLEKLCWNRNIFELLPAIIDQIVFCNQSIGRLDRNEELYTRFEKSIALQSATYKMVMLARKIYEINFKKGMRHATRELMELKNIADKHKDYSRFALCYHNVSLYYKLGSTDYVSDMQVISRHYKKFKTLHEKNPLIPLVAYRRNYNLNQQFHFKMISIFYHYNRCAFNDAYAEMKEMWTIVNRENSPYRIFKTDSLFFNMISSEHTTGRYADALKTIDAYVDFLKDNQHPNKILYSHVLRALVYTESYPKKINIGVDTSFLIEKVDEYIKQLKENVNIQMSLPETIIIKAKLHFILGNSSEALKLISCDEVIDFCNLLDTYLHDLMCDFFSSKLNVYEFKKKINRKIHHAKSPMLYVQLIWMDKNLKIQ